MGKKNVKAANAGNSKLSWKNVSKVTQDHAHLMAKYDALNFLQNASILANAGYAKALELAVNNADGEHVLKCIHSADAILDSAAKHLRTIEHIRD